MKKLSLILAAVFLVGAFSQAQAQSSSWRNIKYWNTIPGVYQGSHLAYTSTKSLLPVQRRLSHFIVSVGPGSWDRGCRVDTGNPRYATGVVSNERARTRLVAKQISRTRRGWRNYVFSASSMDRGIFVQQVNVLFKPTESIYASQCYYQFLHYDLEDDSGWERDRDEEREWEHGRERRSSSDFDWK